MKSDNYITIKQKDGYITRLTYLSCPKKPKASILILHGMAEHQKRYDAFAQYLVDLGLMYFYMTIEDMVLIRSYDLGFFIS